MSTWVPVDTPQRWTPAFIQPLPVMAPEPAQRVRKPKVRASGDPHCKRCTPGDPCEEHQDFSYDPLAGSVV